MYPRHNKSIRKEIHDLLDAGITDPASPAWYFPAFIAAKKDYTPRFCVNYRTLNQIVKTDRCPLPRIDETFEDLSESRFFTTLDFFSGYLQVGMRESCEKDSFGHEIQHLPV